MRLSEAMRLGAMIRPQAIGWILDPLGERTCAWGAALEASGVKIKPEQSQRYNTPVEWRALVETRVKCPLLCGCNKQPLATLIAHLNDSHVLSREEIADFVESIEKQSEIASPESVEQGVTG